MFMFGASNNNVYKVDHVDNYLIVKLMRNGSKTAKRSAMIKVRRRKGYSFQMVGSELFADGGASSLYTWMKRCVDGQFMEDYVKKVCEFALTNGW